MYDLNLILADLLAGVAALAATSAGSTLVPSLVAPTSVTFPAARHALAGAGARFLVFDLFRDWSSDTITNTPLRGGVSGCVGGLAETLQAGVLSAISTKSSEPLRIRNIGPSLLSHGGTLFLCFGGYTLLSTTFFDKQPPPIPMTFLLGAIAGGFGVPTAAAIKNGSLRGFRGMVATGFVKVGTVIGVQVSSAPRLLDWLERQRLGKP